MNKSGLATVKHKVKMKYLQPSLVLLISVKKDESCADYLPRPGAFIRMFQGVFFIT